MRSYDSPIGPVKPVLLVLFLAGIVLTVTTGSVVGPVAMVVAVALSLYDNAGPRRRPPTPSI